MGTPATRHIVQLGYVDNPVAGVDDFIDLGDPASGYNLQNYEVGEIHRYNSTGYDQDNRRRGVWNGTDTRVLTITVDINGAVNNSVPGQTTYNVDDTVAKIRNLQRFIEQTNLYFAQYGGNPPYRSDNAWEQGQAATLGVQLKGTSNMLWWNVIGGDIHLPTDLISIHLNTGEVQAVKIELIVTAAARGSRVVLNNLVAMGDFAPPFLAFSNGTALRCGWSFVGGSTYWYVAGQIPVTTPNVAPSYAPIGKFGNSFLQLVAYNFSTAPSATTNAAYDIALNDVIVPSLWIHFPVNSPSSLTGGALTVALQAYNSSSSSWSTVQTFVNITTIPTANLGTWQRYSGTAYTVATNITAVRLVITCNGTIGAINFTGVAMWKNLIGNVVPNEYMTSGRQVGIPACNVYNVAGDVATPALIKIENRSTSVGQRVVAIGSSPFNPFVEHPVFSLDFPTYSTGGGGSVSDSSIFWGFYNPSSVSTGAAASSQYNLTPNVNQGIYDRRPRVYRAFLIYALNDQTGVTSVKVQLNSEVKTYNIALPPTYSGTYTPGSSLFRAIDLGDLLYGRPGNNWQEVTASLDPNYNASVTLYHPSSNANRYSNVQGLLLIPAQQFTTIDLGASYTNFIIQDYNAGTAPRVGVLKPYDGTYDPTQIELNSLNASATFSGEAMRLWPNNSRNSDTSAGSGNARKTATRFEVLMFRDRDSSNSNLLIYNASDPLPISIEYTPLYLHGIV